MRITKHRPAFDGTMSPAELRSILKQGYALQFLEEFIDITDDAVVLRESDWQVWAVRIADQRRVCLGCWEDVRRMAKRRVPLKEIG